MHDTRRGHAAHSVLPLVLLVSIFTGTEQFSFKHTLSLLPSTRLQLRGGKTMAPEPDTLTLEDFAMHLATMRAAYHKEASDLADETVCRIILTTRIQNLPLSRCKTGASTVPGAGTGLFATRNIAEGELITLYPSDAFLLWEDEEHSPESNVRVFFGKHIAMTDRDASAVIKWGDFEVAVTPTTSILADPQRLGDAAYLAHVAKDAGSRTASYEDYEHESMARTNAEILPLSVDAIDAAGNALVVHMALRAVKDIAEGDEVLVHSGRGYWEAAQTE
jgi:hypothetical protein